ncbi:sugar ABC transporter substrate-binding protein [Bosea massiliensis]|jgi:ribose transport system substrate-binding protein|uniref:Sugar ABC transporter substrate-binding protein n=1 Tax=Bosea massiliensis TaxID=151419 RepID=A0ABW0P2T1_9HYPH
MSVSRRAVLGALGLAAVPALLRSQEVARGITAPRRFAPFNPAAARCSPPGGLTRTLVFAQDNQREFVQSAARGMALAARQRGLAFEVALADNDPRAMVGQVRKALTDRAGALIVAPIDVATLAPVLRLFIAQGGYVGSIVPPPATTILNAPQLATGRALGDAAVDYIRTRKGGEARVVLLTHDSNQFLAQRFVAIRAALKSLPGVRIIADISPRTVDKAGGHATMRTVLLAHSRVDVVLGADTVVLGALAALREAGLARDDQFIGGIDGEPEAIAEMRRNGPYKASVGLASPIFGYALAQHAADWLEGGSVPQGLDILPSLISPESLGQFERDTADPAAVYHDDARRSAYLKAYGNICHDSRADYVDFGWSSELK